MSQEIASSTSPAQQRRVERIRLTYSRGEALRYVSHLDLHLVWERTFRRAGLPLAYSQGFNPHPRLHVACALPLGLLSRQEIIDVWLEYFDGATHIAPAQVMELANRAVPPGLSVDQAEEVALSEPALQTQVTASEFLATPLDPLDGSQLKTAVQALQEASALPRERRGKPYDLRPLIEAVEVRFEGEAPRLWMRLSARDGATGRPEEVMDALGLDPADFRIERLCLFFSKQ